VSWAAVYLPLLDEGWQESRWDLVSLTLTTSATIPRNHYHVCVAAFLISQKWFAILWQHDLFSFFFDSPPVGHGLLIHEVSRITHNDAPQSVRFLWRSDKLIAETSTCTTRNTHNRQTPMHRLGFEPTFSAGEQSQTHALERAATGTGNLSWTHVNSRRT
jgi:hypothetical protein